MQRGVATERHVLNDGSFANLRSYGELWGLRDSVVCCASEGKLTLSGGERVTNNVLRFGSHRKLVLLMLRTAVSCHNF